MNFSIDLTVAETLAVNLNNPWTSPEVATQQSSIYFLVRDPLVGPTERVWWDDADSEYVVLRVPVRDQATGMMNTLNVRAQQIECGAGRIDFHAGRVAHDCPHQAVLWVDPSDNGALEPDSVYETVPSAPLVIDATDGMSPMPERFCELSIWPLLPPLNRMGLSFLGQAVCQDYVPQWL